MTTTEAQRSPGMGWIGVQTGGGALYCWSCAIRLKHMGLMLTDSDAWLADDECDRCGRTILTSEDPPAPDVTRQLVESGCYVAESPPQFKMAHCNYERPGMSQAALLAALGCAFITLSVALFFWAIAAEIF